MGASLVKRCGTVTYCYHQQSIMSDFTEEISTTLTGVKEMMASTDGWDPIGSLPSSVESSFVRDIPGCGVKLVRATGRAKAPAEKIQEILWTESVETKKKEDDTLLKHEELEKFGDEKCVIHQVYKLPWPLANREIVVVKEVVRDDDGTIYHVNRSVQHPKAKETSKVVRAQVTNCSYIFRPVSDTETDVSYIVAFDPMGNIPKWLVNQNQARVAQRVAQVIEKVESMLT